MASLKNKAPGWAATVEGLVRQAIRPGATVVELRDELARHGVEMLPAWTKDGASLKGFKYAYEGRTENSSTVARDLSLSGLKGLGISYESTRDLPALSKPASARSPKVDPQPVQKLPEPPSDLDGCRAAASPSTPSSNPPATGAPCPLPSKSPPSRSRLPAGLRDRSPYLDRRHRGRQHPPGPPSWPPSPLAPREGPPCAVSSPRTPRLLPWSWRARKGREPTLDPGGGSLTACPEPRIRPGGPGWRRRSPR